MVISSRMLDFNVMSNRKGQALRLRFRPRWLAQEVSSILLALRYTRAAITIAEYNDDGLHLEE